MVIVSRCESLLANGGEAEQCLNTENSPSIKRKKNNNKGSAGNVITLLCDVVKPLIQAEEYAPPQHRAAMKCAPSPSLSPAMNVTVS